MAVSEQDRNKLFNKAIELFGEQEAATLMAHLPPGGYPNLATKQDLLELESRLKGFTLRTVLTANLTTAAVFAGIALGAANLT